MKLEVSDAKSEGQTTELMTYMLESDGTFCIGGKDNFDQY